MKIDAKEIWEWLENQKYQTDYEETGEYKMYFDLDMPRILNDFLGFQKESILHNETKQVITDEEIEQIASDEMQQDWNDLKFENVYRTGFVDGAKMVKRRHIQKLNFNEENKSEIKLQILDLLKENGWEDHSLYDLIESFQPKNK